MRAMSTGIDQMMPKVSSCSDASEILLVSLIVRAKTLGANSNDEGDAYTDNGDDTRAAFISLGHTHTHTDG